MAIKVIDLETGVKCPVGNHKAHPMWLGNKVYAYGELLLEEKAKPSTPYLNIGFSDSTNYNIHHDDFVIGHNIKFDLLYMYRHTTHKKLPHIWDTQLAEYLLTGQQHKYASLDELTLKYVGKHALKDDKVKKHWDGGGQTEDIDKEVLLSYLKGDLTNTKAIFLEQWQKAEELRMLPLIQSQMEALRATTSMNLAGMAVDWKYIDTQIDSLSTAISVDEAVLKVLDPTLDWASGKSLSLYFFGGEELVKEQQIVGTYKNGKTKTKLVDVTKKHLPKISPITVNATLGKNGYFSTDDSVLKAIERETTGATKLVATKVSLLRESTKLKTTYYEGIRGLRFPNNFLYPNLNHCATGTGRLSSTNPNLQNQTDKGGIKQCFISRFGKQGSILELDFSQLEIVALAHLSQDRQLIADINSGTDMHTVLYEELYGRSPSKSERKGFKPLSFLLIYGGSAKTLSEQSGFDLTFCKRFISAFYNRYKGVKAYHDAIVAEAKANREIEYTTDGKMVVTFTKKSLTGRRYVFKEYDNSWGPGFSPTELKNYPIQGFATGDIVPMMIGILQRKLEEAGYGVPSSKAMLINTVHDSVELDVHNDVLEEVARLCKTTLEEAPRYLKELFNIDFELKLTVGVDCGPNWGSLVSMEI